MLKAGAADFCENPSVMVYQLTRTNILYQTSKYAPVGVIALELIVSPVQRLTEALSRVSSAIERISGGGLGGSMLVSGGDSLPEMYSQLVLDLQRYAGHSVTYCRVDTDGGDDRFSAFVEYEDSASLVKVPGIGKKTAERLIIEMRDRIDTGSAQSGATTVTVEAGARSEAVDALIALGYKPREVQKLIGDLDVDGKSAEDIIRLALRQVAV